MRSSVLIVLSLTLLIAKEPITPLKLPTNINTNQAALGEKLFFDTRLSEDNTIACATCHILEDGGDDNLPFSIGIHKQVGDINAPTILNAVNNFRQFWDGRAKDLQEQAIGPIENPIEMGFNFPDLIIKLRKTEYNSQFKALYPQGITKMSITHAIAEYEKTLITPNSPFDQYLLGNDNAINAKAKKGYQLFKTKGCISCHHGVNIGGNLYSKFGVVQSAKVATLGRFNITHKERDKYYFKVPSLRNVARTAPYFHDGRTPDLQEAIKVMAQLQLGRYFTQEEVEAIEAFLISLDGDLPKSRVIYAP